MPYVSNKGADQPAHPRSLISTFVVRCLDSIISLVSISKISSLQLASVAAQAGFSLTLLKTLKIGFLVTRLNYSPIRSVQKKTETININPCLAGRRICRQKGSLTQELVRITTEFTQSAEVSLCRRKFTVPRIYNTHNFRTLHCTTSGKHYLNYRFCSCHFFSTRHHLFQLNFLETRSIASEIIVSDKFGSHMTTTTFGKMVTYYRHVL